MPFKGYKQTKKHREKNSESHRGMDKPWAKNLPQLFKAGVSHNKGAKHWCWKGGICQNKEYRSWIKNKRNRILRGIYPKHTFKQWGDLIKIFNYKCALCGKKKPLNIDHIIPISKKGTDEIENIQPLCRNCNSKKSNKIYE